MQIENWEIDDILVLKPIDKRIDASGSADFKSKILDWIQQGRNRFLLDLSEVDFIDSSGLGVLVSILKTMGKSGDLRICGLRVTVMSLFQLTRMNRVFQLYPSVEEAIDAMVGRVTITEQEA